MDEEQSLGDSYRVFLQTMRNRVTSVAGMAELICREAATPTAREHASRNRDLVAGLVSVLARFLDGPLTRSQVGADNAGAPVNGIVEAARRKFALSADSTKNGKTLKVLACMTTFSWPRLPLNWSQRSGTPSSFAGRARRLPGAQLF